MSTNYLDHEEEHDCISCDERCDCGGSEVNCDECSDCSDLL